jgi:hypothetical protein
MLWEEREMMSPADWQMTGCEPGDPDEPCINAIERLADLLSEGGPLWGDLLRETRLLILDARAEAEIEAS